jgi:hypothetical protein
MFFKNKIIRKLTLKLFCQGSLTQNEIHFSKIKKQFKQTNLTHRHLLSLDYNINLKQKKKNLKQKK